MLKLISSKLLANSYCLVCVKALSLVVKFTIISFDDRNAWTATQQ